MTTAIHPQLVCGYDDYVTAWVAERIADVGGNGFSDGKAIGVASADQKSLIAGVVYNEYLPQYKTMQLHIAADNPMWAKKEIIKALLAYPFDQLQVQKCWIAVASDNDKSLKTTEHVGFKREATLAHQFGKGRHAIISRMYKQDYNRLYGDI